MDHTSIETPAERSWNYTLVGWGHDERIWKEFITALRMVGYDHVLSLEMECEFINLVEGLEKSVRVSQTAGAGTTDREQSGGRWWAWAVREGSTE